MATKRTDSFFVRGMIQTTSDAAWETQEIDLGSFVDALGEHVLRIYNISARYQDGDGNGPMFASNMGIQGGQAYVTWCLTTQPLASTTSQIDLSDKSLVASGTWGIVTNGPEAGTVGGLQTNYATISDTYDVAPQDWTNGYLIGVDTLYLSIYQDSQMGPDENRVSICMECVSEKLSKAAGMALALSQS